MAVLRVFLHGRLEKELQLSGQAITIGRLPGNTLVLQDRTVSRHHARLRFDARGKCWQIENLSQTNPVRINGRVPEGPTVLFDGDEIAMGVYRLVFIESPS